MEYRQFVHADNVFLVAGIVIVYSNLGGERILFPCYTSISTSLKFVLYVITSGADKKKKSNNVRIELL